MRGRAVMTEATSAKPGRHRLRRRVIDYPRFGRRGFRRWLPSYRLVLGIFAFCVVAMGAVVMIALSRVTIPQPNDFATRQATVFEYADGHTPIAHIGVNRISVPLSSIPQVVRSAVLSAEDRSFYSESGVSPTGILRALKNDIIGGGDLQGGSTITQQYVKNYYLTQQQTLSRKIEEALISVKIDEQVPKDTILRNYLNTIYFGRDSYGIEAACRAYFGVSVGVIATDPAKAAYLAALIQSPYHFSTADSDPVARNDLLQRWNYVLDGMVTQHWLPRAVRARLTFPTPVANQHNDLAGTNGYLVNAATKYLERQHQVNPNAPGAEEIAQGGYTVVTTFHQDYLKAAQQAVTTGLAGLDPAHHPADANIHVGMAAVDQNTGALLGFYGGPDYLKQGFDDALQASGPLGTKVSAPLATAATLGTSRDWPSTVELLREFGINDAHPNDNPPADDDLSTTPLRAAAAITMAMRAGRYVEPFEVSQVLQDGDVVWHANPPSAGPLSAGPPLTAGQPGSAPDQSGVNVTGHDGSDQWSWTVAGQQNVSIAVDMYATKPDGKGNRALTGMSPSTAKPMGPPTVSGMSNADVRTSQIAATFAATILTS